MDLSVVIVSYNVRSFLDQALTTLQDALTGVDAEVFIVDNASVDGSVQMVRRKYPWVNLIVSDTNLGFARANNLALEKAKGRYALLLNPDTVLRRDTLRTMINFLDSHPEAGAAGCKVLNPDGSLQLACRRGFPTPNAAFYKMTGLAGLFPKSRTFGAYNLTYLDPDSLAEVDALSGSFMMLRKEALDRVGFLDGDFFMYGEDLDLCYRIKEAGWKIYYVPDTEIIHFKGESTKTVPSVRSQMNFYQAMHIFVEKHFGGHKAFRLPQWIIVMAIYTRLGVGYTVDFARRMAIPAVDLVLLNISLLLGIALRFGTDLQYAPEYSTAQWITIFIVYSMLYMATFFFIGMYHRHRFRPERALLGTFIGFLFNVFIVNFIQEYNFSRIASFYCWGFNTITISGWRFVYQLMKRDEPAGGQRRALVVGTFEDVAMLAPVLREQARFDIAGCIDISDDAIRGSEKNGVYVLGLVDDIEKVVVEYGIGVVIMAGSVLPYSRILRSCTKLGAGRPDFKFVPELPCSGAVESNVPGETIPLTMIDIHPG